MSTEINLISSQQKQIAASRRLVWLGVAVGGGLFLLSALSAAAIYGFRLVMRREIEESRKQIQTLQQRLVESAQTEQRQILIDDRLTAASRILAERPDTAERLKKLADGFGEQAAVEQIKVTAGGRRADLTLSSLSFDGLAQSLKILQGGGFAGVEIIGLNRGSSGIFKLGLAIEL